MNWKVFISVLPVWSLGVFVEAHSDERPVSESVSVSDFRRNSQAIGGLRNGEDTSESNQYILDLRVKFSDDLRSPPFYGEIPESFLVFSRAVLENVVIGLENETVVKEELDSHGGQAVVNRKTGMPVGDELIISFSLSELPKPAYSIEEAKGYIEYRLEAVSQTISWEIPEVREGLHNPYLNTVIDSVAKQEADVRVKIAATGWDRNSLAAIKMLSPSGDEIAIKTLNTFQQRYTDKETGFEHKELLLDIATERGGGETKTIVFFLREVIETKKISFEIENISLSLFQEDNNE